MKSWNSIENSSVNKENSSLGLSIFRITICYYTHKKDLIKSAYTCNSNGCQSICPLFYRLFKTYLIISVAQPYAKSAFATK